jgi:hypothetical protein
MRNIKINVIFLTMLLCLCAGFVFGQSPVDSLGLVGDGVDYTPEAFAEQTTAFQKVLFAFINSALVYASYFFVKLRGMKKVPGISVSLVTGIIALLGFGAKFGGDVNWLNWALNNLELLGLAPVLYELIIKRWFGRSKDVAAA